MHPCHKQRRLLRDVHVRWQEQTEKAALEQQIVPGKQQSQSSSDRKGLRYQGKIVSSPSVVEMDRKIDQAMNKQNRDQLPLTTVQDAKTTPNQGRKRMNESDESSQKYEGKRSSFHFTPGCLRTAARKSRIGKTPDEPPRPSICVPIEASAMT